MPVRAWPVACRVRRVDGAVDAVMLASAEEDISTSCSCWRSRIWVSAKRGIDMALAFMAIVGRMILGEEILIYQHVKHLKSSSPAEK